VEIVGPAGAGKTTLCKALSCYGGVHLGNFPDVRNVANTPFFILYGLHVIPISIHVFQHDDRQLSRREFAWLSILNGWPKVLQKELKRNNDIIFLDQGPVYLLSEISLFGPDCLKGEKVTRVWQTWYREWAATLDAIVWLDATDECLIKRIRSRDKDHVVKNESVQMVSEFLERYRSVYKHIQSELAANHNGFKILRFDTNRQASEEIAYQLLMDFDSKAVLKVD
jgi:shikimate kinase